MTLMYAQIGLVLRRLASKPTMRHARIGIIVAKHYPSQAHTAYVRSRLRESAGYRRFISLRTVLETRRGIPSRCEDEGCPARTASLLPVRPHQVR